MSFSLLGDRVATHVWGYSERTLVAGSVPEPRNHNALYSKRIWAYSPRTLPEAFIANAIHGHTAENLVLTASSIVVPGELNQWDLEGGVPASWLKENAVMNSWS